MANAPEPRTELALSIVMPAYNEEHRIGPTLTEYVQHFRSGWGGRFEVVVVANGCRDQTRSVVEGVMSDAPEVRLLEYEQPLGKGGAVWEGLAAASGERLAFADADNMVRAPETERIVRALDGADVAIGDRYGERTGGRERPAARQVVSRLTQLWSRYFLGLPYTDTQCGAKAFRAQAWRLLAPLVCEQGWAFDLDVLSHARRHELRVAEVPVEWKHAREGSKMRLWVDLPKTLAATFGIRRRSRRRP